MVVCSYQPLFPVESAVAAVREETERVAEKIMSEQVKDHQSSQTLGEQWMQDSAKVALLMCGVDIRHLLC